MFKEKDISPIIKEAIQALSRLPGVGKKSAQRMVFHLLRRDKETALSIGQILPRLVTQIHHCQKCRQFTEHDICEICISRQHAIQLCIIESPMDLLAIENSGAYQGRYFILHHYLSPIDGIGPDELGIGKLEDLLRSGTLEEVIIATNGSVDGETTAHFLKMKLEQFPVKISRIAQGIPLGGELEYTDSATLAQAMYHRQPVF